MPASGRTSSTCTAQRDTAVLVINVRVDSTNNLLTDGGHIFEYCVYLALSGSKIHHALDHQVQAQILYFPQIQIKVVDIIEPGLSLLP
jgi:hypothetical protein